MSWIQDLVAQHSELESPKAFWFWAGLSAISAVVKDNVWINRGEAYNLYPNIYVILHADSGMKKGPPINLAKKLVKKVDNTRIISGRSSIQGILKKLGTGYSEPGGKVVGKSFGYINASELSASLVSDPAALTILTDLYDRNYNEGDYESLLKQETFMLKDPTVSLFGGINNAHAETFFERKDIQGGLFARSFIVYEKVEQTTNSLSLPLSNPPDIDKLAVYLKDIAKLRGPFKNFWNADRTLTIVGKLYDEWYNSFRADVRRMDVKDETGTLNRLGDSVLKVAMLLSLGRSTDLVIDAIDIEQAIELGEKLVGSIRQTTMGKQGMSNIAQFKNLVIRELYGRDTHQITRAVLMKKMWMHYSSTEEFDDMMLSFHESGMISTMTMGNQMVYFMPDAHVLELTDFFEGKNK